MLDKCAIVYYLCCIIKHMEKLINWSELSRHITGGDRGAIRATKLAKKHHPEMDKLIKNDLPAWWEEKKTQKQQPKKTMKTQKQQPKNDAIKNPAEIIDDLKYVCYCTSRRNGMSHEMLASIGLAEESFKNKYEKTAAKTMKIYNTTINTL